jgi:hypothetical protein
VKSGGCSRTTTCRPLPVGGRPIRFLVDFLIFKALRVMSFVLA